MHEDPRDDARQSRQPKRNWEEQIETSEDACCRDLDPFVNGHFVDLVIVLRHYCVVPRLQVALNFAPHPFLCH